MSMVDPGMARIPAAADITKGRSNDDTPFTAESLAGQAADVITGKDTVVLKPILLHYPGFPEDLRTAMKSFAFRIREVLM